MGRIKCSATASYSLVLNIWLSYAIFLSNVMITATFRHHQDAEFYQPRRKE